MSTNIFSSQWLMCPKITLQNCICLLIKTAKVTEIRSAAVLSMFILMFPPEHLEVLCSNDSTIFVYLQTITSLMKVHNVTQACMWPLVY